MASILNQPHFQDADKAREYLEALRWPNGVVCPHCGVIGQAQKLEGSKNYRPGLFKCKACRDQFTVTVGTVFERSKIALNVWLQAVHLMCASKKGMSAKQLERMLDVTYKTAWFMCHRIREAMKHNDGSLLGGQGSSGVVEADETFWGAKGDGNKGIKKGGGYAHRMAIVSLVERDGHKRSFHVANVNGNTLKAVLQSQVAKSARVMTDEANYYKWVGQVFASHETVSHNRKEYARGDVTSNTAEASFAILKRGLNGIYHSVSEKHLQRYADEFDYRWNTRQSLGFNDAMRADILLTQIGGKRLTYQRSGWQQEALV